MEKIKISIKGLMLIMIGIVGFSSFANAQALDKMYFNIDWQMNAPLGTKFADNLSGWGMNFESGYFVTKNVAIGAFISYHSNNKYVSRRTLDLNSEQSITSDQQHHIFQLPFGVTGRYTFNRNTPMQPYLAAKLGTEYSKITSQMNVFEFKENKWGFYVSPEIGMNIYLDPQQQVGVHVALYYSYATNKTKLLTYDIDNINNIGFRLGLAF